MAAKPGSPHRLDSPDHLDSPVVWNVEVEVEVEALDNLAMKKIKLMILLALLFGAWNTEMRAADWPDTQSNLVVCARGDGEHWRVKMLQYLLRAQDFKVVVDGNFGKQTETAVRRFQKQNDLQATGVVRDSEWKLLVPDIERGDSGDAVRALQVGINRFIHEHTSPRKSPMPVTGSFGAVTEKWLREMEGEDADGKADGNTWFELLFDEH